MGILKEKVQKNMDIKGFSPRTKKIYLREIGKFIEYFRKSPEKISTDEIKDYLHFLITEKKSSSSVVRQAYSAIKFLYVSVLEGKWEFSNIPRMKQEKRLPVILDISEVLSIVEATSNIKHRAILAVIYSSGLRVSEAANLKITDIDSKRMQIRIEQAKGAKDRYTLLSVFALDLLRKYWIAYHPNYWLFNGQGGRGHISVRSIQKIFENCREKAGISKHVTVHSLRHSFATHLLEKGTDLHHIQLLMGHSSPATTTVYIHVKRNDLVKISSPLDSLSNQ